MNSKYKDVLKRARKRFQQAVEAEASIREEAALDLRFISGDQWREDVKRDRERGPSPRPCLVFNKVLPPVTQLGNQARQNKPAIKVSPVDSAGDPDTAKVLAGMIRHIEYDSDADQAYDTALFYAASCGFGYWMYGCECSDPLSFDQDIKVITISDPFSVYLDCNAVKPDRSDMKWAFVIDGKMPNDVHEARFGPDKADLTSDFIGDLENEGWRDQDTKRVAEYWEVETTKKTLRLRKDADGTVHPVYMEDLEPGEEDAIEEWVIDEKTDKPQERTVEIPQVMQYIINGAEVLEEPTPWDGSTIPIVIVTGLEMVVRGEKKIFSMTRFARDPQQLFNFYKTMEAETISLAPKPKWVGAVGQFRTKRRDWQRANTDNAAYLEYDPIAVGDKVVGEPQWRTFDPPVQSLAIGAAAAAEDIKDSTGYHDPSIGKNRGDQSGVAIGKLQRQGDVSNFHFMDNLARGLKRGGRIAVELIPKKYDTNRQVRIIGEDQKQRIVTVNAPFTDEDGKSKHHKLDLGKYDLVVDQGPGLPTQRMEVREMMMDLAKGDPTIMQLFGDIFFENSDFPGADRMAKRAHALLPPAALAAEDEGDKDIPPAVQQQMAQAKAQIDQLTQANQQLMSMVKDHLVEAKEKSASAERIATQKAESAERIAAENNRARMESAAMLSKSASMNKLAELDHAAVEHELDLRQELLHTQISVEDDAAGRLHEAQQQQADQQHEAAMKQADQQHEVGLQGADAAQESAAQGADQQQEQTLAAQDQQHQQTMALKQQKAAADLAAQARAAAVNQQKTQQAHELKQAKLAPKPAAKKKV